MAQNGRMIYASVLVAALGYFVDVYDIVIFSIVRVSSLQAMGFSGGELLDNGVYLLNMQLIGMLVGGVLWGICGDKFGRLSVLFGSILLYSVANILNAFVSSIDSYAALRLIAGIGLAGELGAGVTLVSEMLPAHRRGYATTVIATVGVSGALLAAVIGELFSWQHCYIIGGAMGLLLLCLRIAVVESGMFESVKQTAISRGNFLMIFTSWDRFSRYFHCLAIGLPIWFVIGIIVTFCPEIGAALNLSSPLKVSEALIYYTIGVTAGDLASGLLSQYLNSRRLAVTLFLALTLATSTFVLNNPNVSSDVFYWALIPLGFSIGYWAVFVTTAAEQFGTNLRATVATSIPNFVRGSAVPMTLLFQYLKDDIGVIASAQLVGIIVLGMAFISLRFLRETYGRDLNFLEVDSGVSGVVETEAA